MQLDGTLHSGPNCGSCPIRHRAVCARCEPDELLALGEIKYYRRFEAGQTLIWSGDRMDFVASVVTGVATLTQVMEDGRTQTVGLLFPSDFVGRPGRDRAPYNVVATTDLLMCCFRKKPFEELMGRTPHIGQRLLEMTLDELDAAREWMLLLGRKTAREKIASFLCIVARRDAALRGHVRQRELTFELPLTREAMADYLGLTLETVSRQVSALKREEIILLQGKRTIHVPDFDRLLEEAGDDADGGLPG
jgi:CRP/FNR family transcriptional regulator